MSAAPRHDAPGDVDAWRDAVGAAHLIADAQAVGPLLASAAGDLAERTTAATLAADLVTAIRARDRPAGSLDALLAEYGLSSEEGILLLCLAEALLRIPDGTSAAQLIGEKIVAGNWASHLGHSPSLLVNASTFGLLLTGRLTGVRTSTARDPQQAIRTLLARASEPVTRRIVLAGVKFLAHQFVMGQTIETALRRARPQLQAGTRFSFDMLGEAARTHEDANGYFDAYAHAIDTLGAAPGDGDVLARPGISVKLSALHPRFEWHKGDVLRRELYPRVGELALRAKAAGLALTIDAEESDRLDLTLDLFEALARRAELSGWNGLGLAVQAYQKRASFVIGWLGALARATQRLIPVRLVKGAYWDTEIKRAQERGLADYPVFTRKESTDTSYLACARALLAQGDALHPQFATHNAATFCAVLAMAGETRRIEFQRLHGMGDALYEEARNALPERFDTRVYAPVGHYDVLLAYLVRRILENGANTSFVNRLADARIPLDALTRDPVSTLAKMPAKAHPALPPPLLLYGDARRNAAGIALDDPKLRAQLWRDIEAARAQRLNAAPLAGDHVPRGDARDVASPADLRKDLGRVVEASGRDIEAALRTTFAAAPAWNAQGAESRAQCLERAADLLEGAPARFLALLMGEAGKTLVNAIGEVRESVDALRYYAGEARTKFGGAQSLPGPVGEENSLSLAGRGVFACIAPWNFPLAIFVGQAAAALAAGNAVIAKSAPQTPLIAHETILLLHRAGVPHDALAFLPGDGTVGAALVKDPRVAGVAFTGSTATARTINQALALRPGPIIPLIAETGGINVMLADSTALLEQVVDDVMLGAFDSAGQRCSATRVLFIQDAMAPPLLDMLRGAIEARVTGDPFALETDIGPIIDERARGVLEAHAQRMTNVATLIGTGPLGEAAAHGHYFAPRAYLLEDTAPVDREVFGPVLHVIRYAHGRLGEVVDTVNGWGYGLTMGLHTRLDSAVETVRARAKVGNLYVNRSQIGAVIGVQPFGGEGLSGTGPKAGGPNYLTRFATERTLSLNTTAAGGNAALLTLDEFSPHSDAEAHDLDPS